MLPIRLPILSVNLDLSHPHPGERSWEQRKVAFRRLVELARPACLLTQEGTQAQLEAIGELLPEFQLIDEQRDWLPGVEYPTVFLRKDALELEDAKDVWLSETPRVRGSKSWGAAAPQIMTLVQARRVEGKGAVVVGSTQLDGQSDRARLEGAGVIVKEAPKFNGDELPIAIGGTFGERPDESVYRLLTGRRTHQGRTGAFRDAFRLAKRSEPGNGTYHGYKKVEGGRIDWLLCEGSLEVQEYHLWSDPLEGRLVSDHHPVSVEFLL